MSTLQRGTQFGSAMGMAVAGAGLAAAGNVLTAWDPASDTLTVHSLQIIRNGQTTDITQSGDGFLVLRQETDLSRAMRPGSSPATGVSAGAPAVQAIRAMASNERVQRIRRISNWSWSEYRHAPWSNVND